LVSFFKIIVKMIHAEAKAPPEKNNGEYLADLLNQGMHLSL